MDYLTNTFKLTVYISLLQNSKKDHHCFLTPAVNLELFLIIFFLTQLSLWVNHLSIPQIIKLLPCFDMHLIHFSRYRLFSANVISAFV